uniref:S41 family peptidase n=1 Tax=Flavobacterium sp. TaxID=239 RepID=UPI004049D135
MKSSKKYYPIFIFGILALGVFIGGKLNFLSEPSYNANNLSKNKLNTLIDFIERDYVDKVNTDSIVDLTVDRILEQLDPHSVYIAKNEMEAVEQSMRGDFVGIGINFYMYKDSVAVIKTIAGGPSEKAGIQSGDRILFADKQQLFGKNLRSDSLFPILKGKKGSETRLTIFRKKDNQELEIDLKRDVIPIKSVDVALMIAPEIGYIKINRFAETTYDEFKKGLVKLINDGATSLVVDLRDNGGGYMEKAVQIADEFLKDEDLIVFTKNKKGRIDRTLATSKGTFEKGDLYLLINENSASASEILAGAIQDNDRGQIVGRRSFGKGLVQREMPLGDGSAVRLTIARYYTPSGRSIQKPYENTDLDTYFQEFEQRFENGELYEKDSIKVADSLKFKTKKGRIVYGGGGIVPDLFVPLEVKHGEEGVELLMQSGLVSFFVFEKLDENRKKFQNITYQELESLLLQEDYYFDDFKNYVQNSGFIFSLSSYKTFVTRYLKAEFAQQVFNDEKYYEILLPEDAMIQAILKANKKK